MTHTTSHTLPEGKELVDDETEPEQAGLRKEGTNSSIWDNILRDDDSDLSDPREEDISDDEDKIDKKSN